MLLRVFLIRCWCGKTFFSQDRQPLVFALNFGLEEHQLSEFKGQWVVTCTIWFDESGITRNKTVKPCRCRNQSSMFSFCVMLETSASCLWKKDEYSVLFWAHFWENSIRSKFWPERCRIPYFYNKLIQSRRICGEVSFLIITVWISGLFECSFVFLKMYIFKLLWISNLLLWNNSSTMVKFPFPISEKTSFRFSGLIPTAVAVLLLE